MFIGLASLLCTHPKVAAVVKAYSSISLLGRTGRNMYIDRLLEYVNLLQQQRMNAFVGFDTALHHTPLLRAMLHVDHAYCEAAHGAAPTEQPLTNSMLNQARLLQDLFLKELGRDLTVPNEHNAFWWTGVKQNMYDGEFRFKMPWVWAERVWDGLSKGVWGARVHWRKYASKWLPHGLWARP